MVTWHKEVLMGTTTDGNGKPVAVYYREGSCLSSDTKPTGDDIFNGSKLIVMDASTIVLYDAARVAWHEWGGGESDA